MICMMRECFVSFYVSLLYLDLAGPGGLRNHFKLRRLLKMEDGSWGLPGRQAELQNRYGRCIGLIVTELGPARGSAMFLDLPRATQREMKQRRD